MSLFFSINSLVLQTTLLGPGCYSLDLGDFGEKNIRLKRSGPNWKRAFESLRLSSIPHMLYRDQWEEKKQLVGKKFSMR